MKESLLQKLKRIRPGDVGHFFLFLFALLPAAIYRRRRPHLWLLCEYANEAQDNAFALFRHLRAAHPEIDAVYAIARRSPEARTVAAIGPTVAFGSFRHWIYYLAAEVNISSQKGGKPNAAVCYLFEVVLGLLKNRRVFLQHGVTKDDLPFLHAENAKLSLFCCAAQPEYEFVRDTFGYPEGAVRLLGFCRFDSLHGLEAEKEGGARCTECFKLRLARTAELAAQLGFDLFTTTLTVSPHKNAGGFPEQRILPRLAGVFGRSGAGPGARKHRRARGVLRAPQHVAV